MTINMEGSKSKREMANDEERRIHIFARQMLVTRLFTASYIGRFYVDSLNDYRDVIQISEGENELIRDFMMIKQRIEGFYQKPIWLSFTEPSDSPRNKDGYCIWTKLENVPFGSYWFTLEDVTFCTREEMVIKVKVIRKVESEVGKELPKDGYINYNEIKSNLFSFFQETVTWHNLKESSKFIFLLCMTIVTALLYSLQYLGDYSLRFFREVSNLVHVSTPLFGHFFNFLSKVVGGFYLLIAMLWNGRAYQPPLPTPNHMRIQAKREHIQAIEAPPRYRKDIFEKSY